MVAGEVVAGRLVRLACARHLRDLETGAARGLTFLPDLAQAALDFFPSVLKLHEGQHEDEPFVLQPWQQFVVGSLFGWVRRNGFRRFRTAYLEIAKGNGKALALDTPIPTPAGWTTMGALRPGDAVFDEGGHPTEVLFATEPMLNHPCYAVRLSDGSEIVADAEHLWLTHALSGRARGNANRRPKREWARREPLAVRPTAEIAATLACRPSASAHPQAKWNHRIDLAGPLECPAAAVPIPPYVLGAWLGDGESASARITIPPEKRQIADEIEREGVSVEWRPTMPDKVPRAILGRGAGFQAALRSLGVLNAKHIPAAYLRASIAQRLALLQGLLDTDGSCSRGRCEFSTTTPALAEGMRELLLTLGFKPSFIEGRAKLYGRDCGPMWRISFTAYRDAMVPFRLERKRDRLPARPTTRPISSGRMIVACEPIASQPVACIKIAAPSGLFLAGRGMVPTHNTPMAAGIGLLGLTADDEHGAEVYAAATTADQAMICWRDADRMVESSHALRAKVQRLATSLYCGETGSVFRPVSSERKSLDGKRVQIALVDEIHEHPDATVVNKLRLGQKGRRQPLIVEITNAGYDRQSICWQHHEYSEKVLEGVLTDDTWFAFVCGLDPCAKCLSEGQRMPAADCADCDQWTDEAVWLKPNPNLGVSIQLDYLQGAVLEAQGMPAMQNIVKRLNFCIWTESVERWLPVDAWAACGAQPVTLASLRGRQCHLGLDLSSVRDLTAAALVAIDGADVDVAAQFWAPAANIRERVERDRVPYDVWARDGHLTLTEGNVVDYDAVVAWVAALGEAHGIEIVEVCMDPWNATDAARRLEDLGLTVQPIRQTFQSLTAPSKALEKLISTGHLHHGANPVLTWCAANVVVELDPAGNIKPSKRKSTERIDGIAALVNALARAIVAGVAPEPQIIRL